MMRRLFSLALLSVMMVAFTASGAMTFSVTPYVQHPATNAMSVIWFAKGGSGEAATISWRPAAGGAVRSQSVTGTWAVALTNNVASGSDSAVHGNQYKYRHRITGLTPGTAYNYTVTLSGGTAYSNTFRTSPDANASIRFIYYNDSETQPGSTGAYETWDVSDTVIVSNTVSGATSQRTSRPDGVSKYYVDQTVGYASNIVRMVERQPDLYVIAGDLAAQGGKQQNWDEFWRHNAGTYNDPAGSVPILAAIGNHDIQDSTPRPSGVPSQCEHASGGEVALEKYLSYFEVEPNGVDFSDVDARDRSQMFHRVDYGPVTFLFLDTNNGDDSDPEKDTNIYLFRGANQWNLPTGRSPDFNPGSRQYTWLTNNLADAQRNAKFTFVVNHHCPYSVGYHNRTNVTESGEWLSGRAVRALTGTMLKYGVAGWLCGHDEIMEHSRISGTETLPDGTTRATVLNVFDMGTAGDGLRGKQITKEANRYEVFRAQKDAPEIYNQNNILVDGGKHYGHMEVNVREVEPGLWTATMEPVYVFVHKDANGKAAGFERRVYADVTVLTNDLRTSLGGYFPRTATAGQNGSIAHPYEIADVDDLLALRDAVAEGIGTDRYFRQVADIDMSTAGAFEGIGTFSGVYDGGNFTISNLTFTPRTYAGLFNEVTGGTIQNLKIRNIDFPSSATGSYGGAPFVGKAEKGTVLRNLVALGTIGSAARPFTHNAAGVAIRLNGAQVFDCTNAASIYGSYTKAAGIAAFTQNVDANSWTTTITRCAHVGSVTSTASGVDGVAGIIGYVNEHLELRDCSVTGSVFGTSGARVAPLVGRAYGFRIDAGGAMAAPADRPPVALIGGNSNAGQTPVVSGLTYATVADGWATFVADANLASGGTYRVMLDQTSATTFYFTHPGKIAFDTVLFPFAGRVTAAAGLPITRTTSGTITTYMAGGIYLLLR